MRRYQFLKSIAALAAVGSLTPTAQAAVNLKMMIPANPGGGWDGTGRALGKVMQDAGLTSSIAYENKGELSTHRSSPQMPGNGRCPS